MKIEKIVLIFLTFFLLFLGFFHKITAMNQDLGRHFLLGGIVLKTLNVPKINLFSYTYPDFPFINLHWFSEVIFYLIFKAISFNGLLIFSTFIVLLAFLIVFLKAYKNNPIPTTISSILYFGVLFERTEIRPEIFSFLFLSIFIVVLYKNREKATKIVFLLPLIALFWVNMHIYFAIGLSIVGLFLIESIIVRRKEISSFFKKSSPFPKNTLYLLIVLIFSIIASNVNPNGLKGVLYPLYFWQNYGYPIEENQNIFFLWQLFQLPTIIYFAVSSLLLFIFLFINIRKSRLIDWFLSIFFVLIAAIAIRNFPLFVFGTFIIFVYNFSSIYKKIPNKLNRFILALVFIALLFQIVSVSKTKAIGLGVEENAKNGADFFLKNNLKGPLFNNFDIGSYLDYRFYPKERVFVDGRPGEYPVSFFKDIYIPMQSDLNVFKKVDKKYKFNAVFVSYMDQTPWANQFLKTVVNDSSWKTVYLDDFVLILVRNTSQNSEIIKRYGFGKENARVSNLDTKNKDALLKLAIFSSKVGWINLGEKSLKQLLVLEPNNCDALYGLLIILQTKNDQTLPIYLSRYQVFCK